MDFQWERAPIGHLGIRKAYVSNRDTINHAGWETQFQNLLAYYRAEHGHMRVLRGSVAFGCPLSARRLTRSPSSFHNR